MNIIRRLIKWVRGLRRRSVLSDAGREGNELVQQLAEGMLDARLMSTGTSTSNAAPSMDDRSIYQVAHVIGALEQERAQQIALIVVTSQELFGAAAIKIKYNETWYLLVRACYWQQIKESLPAKNENLPYSPFSLSGVPWVEDEELAGRILLDIRIKHWAKKTSFSLN